MEMGCTMSVVLVEVICRYLPEKYSPLGSATVSRPPSPNLSDWKEKVTPATVSPGTDNRPPIEPVVTQPARPTTITNAKIDPQNSVRIRGFLLGFKVMNPLLQRIMGPQRQNDAIAGIASEKRPRG
jgi:hypothetical protein